MKVLLSGSNPNIQFYTSRFQTIKDVQLFHVSNIKSNIFELQTEQYGTVKYSLENHFTSLQNLIEGVKLISKDFKFDLIILSVSSLNELTNIFNILKPVIDTTTATTTTNNNSSSSKTKILIESSGYLSLESFVLNNNNNNSFSQSNIFSILTSYDIREINSNIYKQQPKNQKESNSKNNLPKIILGKSSYPISNNKQIKPKYNSQIQSNLKDLESLFKKVFIHSDIMTCNMEPKRFISEQWSLAIPNICLNPVMILFQESNIGTFLDEILAKPLISGLVTEILTIAKNSNIPLGSHMNNETHIIESWKSHYQNLGDVPALVFNFKHQLLDQLNLNLLLLNPILLADDLSIKTPYLEFLYTVMLQYSNINKGESEWFIRKEMVEQLKQSIEDLTNDKEKLLNNYRLLRENFEKNNTELTNIQKRIKFLELENTQLKQSNEIKLSEKDKIINDLQLKISSSLLSSSISNSNNDTQASNGQTSIPPTQTESKELLDINMSINEKQQQLLDKELDLKKKELELEKKLTAIQQQQLGQGQGQGQRQLQQPLNVNNSITHNPSSPMTPLGLHSPPNIFKPQQLPYNFSNSSNGTINRSNHSTPTIPNINASKFVDPVSSSFASPLDIADDFQQLHHKSSFGSHPIKPTSRKNRKSNLPTIGNASSIGFNDVSTSANILSPVSRRVSSLPVQSTNFHTYGAFPDNNNASRQGLGILDIPQQGQNISLGPNGNTYNTTANTNITAGNNNRIGSRSLTPLNTNFSKQQTTKPIQFGSNKNSILNNSNNNNNNNNDDNKVNLTENTNNNSNISSNENSLISPAANLFNSSPGQSSTPTPVLVNHKFEKNESTNPITTNTQEITLNETNTNGKGNKTKKKFGGLFHRNKK